MNEPPRPFGAPDDPREMDPEGRPLPPFAPVIMESDPFGQPPRLPGELLEGDDSRSGLTWFLAIVLAAAFAGWLITYSGAQATSREVALPAIERVIEELAGASALTTLHRDEIVAAGASVAGDTEAAVVVPAFPVPEATLTAIEARDGTPQVQARLLLRRAAELVYERGPDVIRDPSSDAVATSTFSTPSGVRRLLGELSADRHSQLSVLRWPLGGVALATLALLLLAGRGFSRFTATGAAVTAGAVLALLFALALRLAISFVGDDGTQLAEQASAVARSLAWAPAHNALRAGALGLALLIPSLLLGSLFAVSVRRADIDPPGAGSTVHR